MELDEAYANGKYIPDGESYPAKWNAEAAAFRTYTNVAMDVPYGSGPRHRFDLFQPHGKPRGIVVFVHGGYWLHFDKSTWSHLAAGAVAQGWAVAMPSYDLCPAVRVTEITRQIAAAVGVIAQKVDGPIRLTGHSAGGHLVARMADRAVAGTWAARIDRIVPISPLSDLEPLLQTSMNTDLRLDAPEARAESPIRQAPPDTDVTIVVGGDERPAFLDQAARLAQAWGVPNHIENGKHHFDIIDGLANPESELTRIVAG